MGAYGRLTTAKMVAMYPKQGMFPGIFTHSVHVCSSRKFQKMSFKGMRIYVSHFSPNDSAGEEIWQVPESAKTPKTANTFYIPLMLIPLTNYRGFVFLYSIYTSILLEVLACP